MNDLVFILTFSHKNYRVFNAVKPRSEQNSVTLYVPELGKEQTNLTYTFFANPKPRIFWDIDGVAISAGFSTNDRRVEALQLEQVGVSEYRVVQCSV